MSVQHLFNALFNASLVVMLLTLISSLGMTFSMGEIVAPLKRVWLLVGAVAVNVVLAPLVAIGVSHLFPISSAGRSGLALAAMAAGAPVGLKACELAKRADLAMGVSFVIVLQVINIVAAPLWAKAFVTGAKVNPWNLIGDLLILVLAPLVVGLILHRRYPEHRQEWKAGLEKTSNIALYALIAFGLAANWKAVVTAFGSWVILASIVIIVVNMALGWAVAFRNQQAAVTISMITGMRFIPAGLVVITTVLHNNGAYLTPALLFGLVDTIVPFLIAAEVGRFVSRSRAKPAPAARVAAAAPPAASNPSQTT